MSTVDTHSDVPGSGRAGVVREARAADLPALRELAAAALSLDADAPAVVDLLWGVVEDTPQLRVVATVDDRPVGVALGSVGRALGAYSGHVNLIAVTPEHRGHGYGRTLLAELEARLRTAGAEQFVIRGSVPAYAWPGIDVRYTEAICLALSAGYRQEPEYSACNMTADLRTADLATGADVARLAALGVTVRRLRAGDAESFIPWMRQWGGTWHAEAQAALRHDPVGCHIALREAGAQGPEYLGFACQGTNRPGWFGPMGTVAAARGLGIGAVLLRRCLADARAAGETEAQLAWVGPYGFYSRTVGARIERVFWLFRKTL